MEIKPEVVMSVTSGAPSDRAVQEGLPDEVTSEKSAEKQLVWGRYRERVPGKVVGNYKGPGDKASWTMREGVAGIQ